MQNKLFRGITIVLFANIINMVFGILNSLILPKYLSIPSYAAIKEYQLYLSYVGILHFGYNDAMYLRYGGKRINEINKNEVVCSLSTIRIYILIISLVGLTVSFIIDNRILLCVSAVTAPTIMLSYYQFLYQASGEFKKYGRLLNIISVGTFFINAFLIFAVHTDSYFVFLITYVALSMFTCLLVECSFGKMINKNLAILYFRFSDLFEGMRNGVLLTLGNFSSTLMTTMDRWFVNILMSTSAFAQYSFAVSMENFLNVLISPITVTLYNYFCKNKEQNKIDRLRKLVIIFASIIIAVAYPARFILEVYLDKYIESGDVIVLLFASQLFYVVIKGIYVNLYKSRGQLKKYFNDLVLVIVFGFVANCLFYLIMNKKEGFAIATLVSSAFWMALCIHRNKDCSINEILYISTLLGVFIITGLSLNAIVGLIVYGISVLICLLLFLRESFNDIKAYCVGFVKGKL